jgi:hypothetical protein
MSGQCKVIRVHLENLFPRKDWAVAPEFPPTLVILDARSEGGKLRATCEYVEAKQTGTRLRVRWGVGAAPNGFSPVGGGVAYVSSEGDGFSSLSLGDMIPAELGDHRYRWTEGLNMGLDWLMFVVIFPVGFTLDEPEPKPASVKMFQGRLALYWALPGDRLGRSAVEWTLSPLRRDLEQELIRLNRLMSNDPPSKTTTFTVEDTDHRKHSSGLRHNPWVSGSFYLVALLVTLISVGLLSNYVRNAWLFPAILVTVVLFLIVVFAFQLRNDDLLDDKTLSGLVSGVLRRLPLIGRTTKRG